MIHPLVHQLCPHEWLECCNFRGCMRATSFAIATDALLAPGYCTRIYGAKKQPPAIWPL